MAILKPQDCSRFTPVVPERLPEIGDHVRYVLGPSGSGIRYKPKTRAAIVTEDWRGPEKHPTGQVRGPDGKIVVELDQDGKPVLYDQAGKVTTDEKGQPKPYVPAGCVNLEVHLDMAGDDKIAGHGRFPGHVLYDPEKSHGTWHWPAGPLGSR